MGCDIHLYPEIKINGVWLSADIWEKHKNAEEGEESYIRPMRFQPATNRNYRFFGFLANVRNADPTAGVPVISQPRGFPNYCSSEVLAEAKSWECDAHSHSYHTKRQLEEAWGLLSSSDREGMNSSYHEVMSYLWHTQLDFDNFDKDEIRIVFWFDN